MIEFSTSNYSGFSGGLHSAFGEATIDEDPGGDGTVITYNQCFPGQYFRERGQSPLALN